jgi:two-component sensor histidine kinase
MVRELQREYRRASGSPADARNDVAAYLADVGHSELIPVAALLVSELVTNSVEHAAGAVTLRAMWAGEVFRVDVSDHGGGVRVARDPDVSGRGLAIVDALATDWGVTQFDGTGRVTWFELR